MNMAHIEKTENIPVIAQTDILVCGGGPAGVGAAIRGAREGAKVMIVEMGGCLGGIATAGMMSHWGGTSSSKILPEIAKRSREKDLGFSWKDENQCPPYAIPHDLQMIVLEEMMKEEGIEVLYYTMVCDAVVEDSVLTGVIV